MEDEPAEAPDRTLTEAAEQPPASTTESVAKAASKTKDKGLGSKVSPELPFSEARLDTRGP